MFSGNRPLDMCVLPQKVALGMAVRRGERAAAGMVPVLGIVAAVVLVGLVHPRVAKEELLAPATWRAEAPLYIRSCPIHAANICFTSLFLAYSVSSL
jgi:hypothetical protein